MSDEVKSWVLDQLRGGETVNQIEADHACMVAANLLPPVPTIREVIRSLVRDGKARIEGETLYLVAAASANAAQKTLF